MKILYLSTWLAIVLMPLTAVAEECADSYLPITTVESTWTASGPVIAVESHGDLAYVLDGRGVISVLAADGDLELISSTPVDSLASRLIIVDERWLLVGGAPEIYAIDLADLYAPVVHLIAISDTEITDWAVFGDHLFTTDGSLLIQHYDIQDLPFAASLESYQVTDMGLPLPPLSVTGVEATETELCVVGTAYQDGWAFAYAAFFDLDQSGPQGRLVPFAASTLELPGVDFAKVDGLEEIGDEFWCSLSWGNPGSTDWWAPLPSHIARLSVSSTTRVDAEDLLSFFGPELRLTELIPGFIALSDGDDNGSYQIMRADPEMGLVAAFRVSGNVGEVVVSAAGERILVAKGNPGAVAAHQVDDLAVGQVMDRRLVPYSYKVVESGHSESNFWFTEERILNPEEDCEPRQILRMGRLEGSDILVEPNPQPLGAYGVCYNINERTIAVFWLDCGSIGENLVFDAISGERIEPLPENWIARGSYSGTLQAVIPFASDFIQLWDWASGLPQAAGVIAQSDGQRFEKYILGLNRLYVWVTENDESYIETFDISDPLLPVLVSQTDESGRLQPRDIRINGSLVILSGWDDYLGLVNIAYDLSNSDHPVYVGQVDYPGHMFGDLSFAASNDTLRVMRCASWEDCEPLGFYVHPSNIINAFLLEEAVVVVSADEIVSLLPPCGSPLGVDISYLETTMMGSGVTAVSWSFAESTDPSRVRLVLEWRDGRREVPFFLDQVGNGSAELLARDYAGKGQCYLSLSYLDQNGWWKIIDTIAVDPLPELPRLTNFATVPNPFNPASEIRFELRQPEYVRLTICDTAGRCVTTLWEGPRLAGPQSITWNGRDRSGAAVASGAYFARIELENLNMARKLLLVR